MIKGLSVVLVLLPFMLLQLLVQVVQVQGVKAADFKTCQQCGFCKRHRAWQAFRRGAVGDVQSHGDGQPQDGTRVGEGEGDGTRVGEGGGGGGGESGGEPSSGAADQGASSSTVIPSYAIDLATLQHQPNEGRLTAHVRSQHAPNAIWHLSLQHTVMGIWHVSLDEQHGAPRYRIPKGDVVDEANLPPQPYRLLSSNTSHTILHADASTGASGTDRPADTRTTRLTLHHAPFALELHRLPDAAPLLYLNHHQLLYLEHQRPRPNDDAASDHQATHAALPKDMTEDLWSETFNGHTDQKPNGPMSIGMDITFPGFQYLYGLPEHATSLNLKSTRGSDDGYKEPYRFYNVDIFEYDLDSPMALYGAVPFAMAVRPGAVAGALWLNPSETWVDVWRDQPAQRNDGSGLAGKLASFFSGGAKAKDSKAAGTATTTHWFSESGIVNLYLFTGSQPNDIYAAHTLVTGRPYLPPYFSIAYHQCRWNYKDTQDVARVHAAFDAHDLPLDVVWLDIEHTSEKAYFTWDAHHFADPGTMIDALAAKGRRMVTIIDPHIKVKDGYYVHQEAMAKDLFVHKADPAKPEAFSGHCWPGNSMWVDYTNPEARAWWSGLFQYDKYVGSRETLFTWNDMNEPSVFGGPEVTMPKDLLHHNQVEHRDIHNLYGMYMHRATYEGHVQRSLQADGATHQRPFVLSRAFYAGTQRYGPIWTGDNMARWDHMRASIPMLLSLSLAGISFAGADVGGFFGNPSTQLLVRWYQLAAYTPFFRAHGHIETARREPYLFDAATLEAIRAALRQRYRLLPLWYTLHYEASVTGAPPMRPLWSARGFASLEATYGVEDAFMLGDGLLVHPVAEEDQRRLDLYLPGAHAEERWYDFFTGEVKPHGRYVLQDLHLLTVPVYLRGGSIVPVSSVIRRAASRMHADAIALLVASDHEGCATGTYYFDDGETNAHHLHGAYLYTKLTLTRNTSTTTTTTYTLQNTPLHSHPSLRKLVQRITLYGLPSGLQHDQLTVVPHAGWQDVKLPRVDLSDAWRITLHTATAN